MSEFKFACPVCGQHITADAGAAGSKLDCPTCFRKIVVPQAPASADPKFVLSAAVANKPRPTQAGLAPEPATPAAPARKKLPIVLAVVGVLCVAGATLFIFRGKIFKHDREQAEVEGDSASDESTDGAGPAQLAINQVNWDLDLTDEDFPEGTASGRIRGRDFVCERAILQGGTLTLRRPRTGNTDLGISIYFFAKQAEELDGKTLSVTTNNVKAPRATLRWREDSKGRTQSLENGYALKLEFGKIQSGRIPGKIYMCLSDEARSYVAGTFNAEVRKPSPPRPAPPKPN